MIVYSRIRFCDNQLLNSQNVIAYSTSTLFTCHNNAKIKIPKVLLKKIYLLKFDFKSEICSWHHTCKGDYTSNKYTLDSWEGSVKPWKGTSSSAAAEHDLAVFLFSPPQLREEAQVSKPTLSK